NGNHPDPGTSNAPYRIYNIGNNQPVELTEFIAILESVLGTKAQKEFCDLQPGDVVATCADVDDLMQDVGFRPNTPLETGIQAFVAWFREYYGR
ncbi:MAG: capsular biosynthesis protein CpsI, partial [Desulfobacterales bacterium]|nr:capsular biosynthesis protein CpsI [Desulfobacterales bacterium]